MYALLQVTALKPLPSLSPQVFAKQHSLPSLVHDEHKVSFRFVVKLLLQVTTLFAAPVFTTPKEMKKKIRDQVRCIVQRL
jgi:hypothetical protein